MIKRGGFLLILLLIVLTPPAFSITLWDLINFFNFNFFTTKINVTNHNDFMIDKNQDGISDTLNIELTTDGSTGTYLILIDLYDENIIKNETNKTLSSGTNKFNITFSTEFFTKNKFNYTIKIYEENYSLKYSKEDIETQFYNNYETAINIINISDNSINNISLQINLTLNFTKNNTYDIIAYLKYNDSTIFSKINESISVGLNDILINFSNETIKNTHYVGKFNLTNIKINNKIIKTDYTTNFYDYKDFAQTSHFIKFSDYGSDSNNNDLFDFLKLNITMEIKNNDNYKIELAIYDLFGNFIKKVEKNETFSIGTNKIIIDINGTEIYNKKLNGPFIVRYAKLIENSNIADQIDNFYTTQNYNYTNFEKPNLPDLNISIDVSDGPNYGINNITFNVTVNNIGNKAAFNIFLEIFDNYTYSRNESSNILLSGNSIKYAVNLVNISDMGLNAIVDFDDLIEESNESNNILKKTIKINKKPTLGQINNLTVNETDLILINANATDNNSDNLSYCINYSKFIKNSNIFSWKTTTLDSGNYTIKINVSDEYLYDFKTFQIIVLDKPDLDSDNDGINDSIDRIIGNNQSINTSTINISFFIDNSTNLSKVFDGMKKVEFKDKNATVVEFHFNFSYASINLKNIVINKQVDNLTGAFVFSIRNITLPEGFTKTIYVDRLNTSQNGVCIKDAEVTTINEISDNCNDNNEFKIECDGTSQDNYNCTYINTTSKYKITGLNNSGIKQIDYTQEQDSETTTSSTSPSGGGGTSTAGSGSCLENWQCTPWNTCMNNTQTRKCQDINNCKTLLNKPIESWECSTTEKPTEKLEFRIEEKGEKTGDNAEYPLPDITGYLLNPPENAHPSVGALIVFVVIVAGLFGYFYFTYKD